MALAVERHDVSDYVFCQIVLRYFYLQVFTGVEEVDLAFEVI